MGRKTSYIKLKLRIFVVILFQDKISFEEKRFLPVRNISSMPSPDSKHARKKGQLPWSRINLRILASSIILGVSAVTPSRIKKQ